MNTKIRHDNSNNGKESKWKYQHDDVVEIVVEDDGNGMEMKKCQVKSSWSL